MSILITPHLPKRTFAIVGAVEYEIFIKTVFIRLLISSIIRLVWIKTLF